MANEQNLTQKGKRLSTERAQELAALSAKKRREKAQERKSAREFVVAALNSEIEDKENGKTYIAKDVMIRKLIARAISEVDLNAIKYILELAGEAPQQADAREATVEEMPDGNIAGFAVSTWLKMEKLDVNSDD